MSTNYKEIEKGENMGKEMEDFLNTFSDEERKNAFLDYMTKYAHRTLQQRFFALLLEGIERFASLEDRQCDGRNEYSVKTARKIKKLMDENKIGVNCPYI